MNLIYISPHYPPHYSQFVVSLARHGIKVFGITDIPYESLTPELQNSLAGHYKVDRLENTAQILQACEFFISAFGPIDRVESHLEPWIELESQIREKFNVTGLRPDDLQFLKRKSKMKDIFLKAKVPSAKGTIVTTFEKCKKFINKQYPFFIKPDIGVGATDTYTIKNETSLKEFFELKQSYDYFLEEYVHGDLESFDGLTDKEGNIVFFTSHMFSNDIHNLVKNNENLWYYSRRKIPSDLENYGRKIVKEAKIKEKFFHIEFFRLYDGTLKALEINMRPPGGITTHMFNYACDIDVYDWWASIMKGDYSKRDYERRYHCAHIGRQFNRNYRYSHDDLYAKWGSYLIHNQPMNPIEYLVMGNWVYVARTEDENTMKEIIRDLFEEAK